MGAEFTKGPWHAMCISDEIKPPEKGRRDCHCGFIFDSDNCEKTLAKVMHNDPRLPHYEGLMGVVTIEEKNANARLIVAAPGLYEALAGIMHYAYTGAAACDVYTDEQPEFVAAKAALAKARGEA